MRDISPTEWIETELKKYDLNHHEVYKLYDDFKVIYPYVYRTRKNFRRRVRRVRERILGINPEKSNNVSKTNKNIFETKFSNSKKSCEVYSKSYRITSLDELLDYCDVDRDEWIVDRHTINKWEVGTKVDNEIITEPLFQIKAYLKRNEKVKETNTRIADLIEDAKKYAPHYSKINYGSKNNKYMLEMNIPDPHFGQLSWYKEVGVNYDIKIADKLFRDAVYDLLEHVSHLDLSKILFVLGNDFFNVNNKLNTTVNNTYQDEDCRWTKTFVSGRKLCVDIIDQLRHIAPVDVLICTGNHDEERSFYLGDALECWYHRDDNVSIDNDPRPRKYRKWGNTLLGFTHGNDIKLTELPGVMAEEEKHMWSETRFREWHTGHFHKEKSIYAKLADESPGVKILMVPSLVPPNVWSNNKGFLHLRKAMSFLYDKEKGEVQTNNFMP